MKQMKQIYHTLLLMLLVGLSACDSEKVPEPTEENPFKQEVWFHTRAADIELKEGESTGVFIAQQIDYGDYDLLEKGNFADNMKFTLKEGKWVPATEIVWDKKVTQAIYAVYYPYQEGLTSIYVPWEVQTDQRSLEAFEKSDFLAEQTYVSKPRSTVADIELKHKVCKLVIKVKPGNGFTQDMLNASNLEVNICNVYTKLQINLSKGYVTVLGKDDNKIRAYKVNNQEFQALLPGQSVYDFNNFVEIVVDGISYYLRRNLAMYSNKQYTLTVYVTKTDGGINVGIGSWDIVDEDFGGIVN